MCKLQSAEKYESKNMNFWRTCEDRTHNYEMNSEQSSLVQVEHGGH